MNVKHPTYKSAAPDRRDAVCEPDVCLDAGRDANTHTDEAEQEVKHGQHENGESHGPHGLSGPRSPRVCH